MHHIMRNADRTDTEEINRQRTKEIYRRRKQAMLERIQQSDAITSKSSNVSMKESTAINFRVVDHLIVSTCGKASNTDLMLTTIEQTA